MRREENARGGVERTLRELPRVGAGEDFAAGVLARLAEESPRARRRFARPVRGLRASPWALLAAVVAATLLGVGLAVWWRPRAPAGSDLPPPTLAARGLLATAAPPREVALADPRVRDEAARLEALRHEYLELERELVQLKRLAALGRPVLRVGGDEEFDYDVDLTGMDLTALAGAAEPQVSTTSFEPKPR